MENNHKQSNEVELLKLEYQQCQNGYNSRDRMVEDEFCKVVELFLFLVATLFLFDRFATVSQLSHCAGCAILGIAGLFCLFSLLVSMESNASCNVALRERCRQIEEHLHELVGFQLRYWQTIDQRAKHLEERLIKGTWGATVARERGERERNIFINTVRLVIALWIIILAITIGSGVSKQIKAVSPDRSVSVTQP